MSCSSCSGQASPLVQSLGGRVVYVLASDLLGVDIVAKDDAGVMIMWPSRMAAEAAMHEWPGSVIAARIIDN